MDSVIWKHEKVSKPVIKYLSSKHCTLYTTLSQICCVNGKKNKQKINKHTFYVMDVCIERITKFKKKNKTKLKTLE